MGPGSALETAAGRRGGARTKVAWEQFMAEAQGKTSRRPRGAMAMGKNGDWPLNTGRQKQSRAKRHFFFPRIKKIAINLQNPSLGDWSGRRCFDSGFRSSWRIKFLGIVFIKRGKTIPPPSFGRWFPHWVDLFFPDCSFGAPKGGPSSEGVEGGQTAAVANKKSIPGTPLRMLARLNWGGQGGDRGFK